MTGNSELGLELWLVVDGDCCDTVASLRISYFCSRSRSLSNIMSWFLRIFVWVSNSLFTVCSSIETFTSSRRGSACVI